MRQKLASVMFGGSCFLCRGGARELLCAACDADLPRLAQPLCPPCALPSPGGARCGRCLSDRPAYDATQAAIAYDFPGDALVHALKFRGELALAPLLAAPLAARIDAERVDYVVPVPLSAQRLRRRGYNQAVESRAICDARRASSRWASARAMRRRRWSCHTKRDSATCAEHSAARAS